MSDHDDTPPQVVRARRTPARGVSTADVVDGDGAVVAAGDTPPTGPIRMPTIPDRRRRSSPRPSTPPLGATKAERRRNVAGLAGLAALPSILERIAPEIAEIIRGAGDDVVTVALVLAIYEVMKARAALQDVASDVHDYGERIVRLETRAKR